MTNVTPPDATAPDYVIPPDITAPENTPDPNVPDAKTPDVPAEPAPEKRSPLPSGGSVYVDDNGDTRRETADGSHYVAKGDVYDSVVALVSLFPDKF